MPALPGTPLNTYVDSTLQHSSTPLLHPFWDLGFGFSPFHRLVMAFYGILRFMYCAACGANNPAEAHFCAKCGAGLAGRCLACGAELPLGARFCPRCGKAIHSPQSAVQVPGSPAGIDAAAQQKEITELP